MLKSMKLAQGSGPAMGSPAFTLVELMIVVAIIGILAAIAIPNFIAMQMRAKRSELITNVSGIRTAEKAYHHEWDSFTSADKTPAVQPGRTALEFTAGGVDAFELLGWTADGLVYGQYSVRASSADVFLTVGTTDIDGDATAAMVSANHNAQPTLRTDNNIY
jgi:type IV pilus assembly protein PilA